MIMMIERSLKRRMSIHKVTGRMKWKIGLVTIKMITWKRSNKRRAKSKLKNYNI